MSSFIKRAHISEQRPSKVQRTSSSDTEPINTDVFDELKSIQESLLEIRATMMKKDDIKNIVTDIVSEIKGELKKEIITEVITEVKDTLTKELSTTVTTQVKDEFIKEIDEKSKIFESRTKEIADGMNMDMNDLKEKFHEQLAELRYLKANLQEYKSLTVTAYTQANQKYAVLSEKQHQVYRVEGKGAGRLALRLDSHHETNDRRNRRTQRYP